MRTRIGAQLILGVVLVTILSIGLMALVILPRHRAELIAQVTYSADQISETIKSSARDSMLENRRDHLRRQIEAVGRQEGIERIRLFNKEGTIMLSSDPSEIGHSVDKKAEACYACHAENGPLEHLSIPERSRTFRQGSGGRLLGIINPIQNEPGCAADCHAHDPGDTVLGVLDVTMPLDEVDAQIARSQGRMAALAALTLVASALLLWWLNRRLVVGPVAALVEGTKRVAEGDLTATIRVTANHELGDLARAFNDMTRRLAEAQRQLTQADKLASIGRLAAGVAHEINSPLTGVLSYASFLQKRATNDPELKGDLDVIVRETKRCREIVKELLDFARPVPPKRQPTNLNDVVRRAVAVVMNQLSVNRVALNLDLTPDLPRVPADGNQIQQVVVNLVLNAADAIGNEGGEIRIASRRAQLPPWGHAPIRKAVCPRGCDLRDSDRRIGGLAAIRVLRTHEGREEPFSLDPVYGRFNHLASEPLEEGAATTVACPRCRSTLAVSDVRCGLCDAAVFAVQVPEQGRVEWCTRNGCHWARWPVREAAGPEPVVEIEVRDTGRGIPPEVLPHLFEPFFSTKGARGIGLGLAVTWGIVEGHGGSIDVESEQGRGSRFTVRLPVEKKGFHEAAAA